MSGIKAIRGFNAGGTLNKPFMPAKKNKEPVKTETPLNPVMIEPTKKKVFSTTSGSSGRSLLGG